jgi:hypothetical protein
MFDFNPFRTVKRVPLEVDQNRVKHLLGSVGNKKFQQTYLRWFRIYPDNSTDRESIDFLACWAQTGMSSKYWAQISRQVFDLMLPFTYAEYEAQGYLKAARLRRYRRPAV